MNFLKKIIFVLVILAIGICAFLIIYRQDRLSEDVGLSFLVQSGTSDQFQVFYAVGHEEWKEEKSVSARYNQAGEWQKLQFQLPRDTEQVRIDAGTKQGVIKVANLIVSGNVKIAVPLRQVNVAVNQLHFSSVETEFYELLSVGEDPFFSFEISSYIQQAINTLSIVDILKDLFFSLLICFLSGVVLKYLKETIRLIRTLFSGRNLIMSLARNDFKTKYASSYLGITWGFIQPILTIITYWFVFQVGLRSGNVSDVPFILWFIPGIVPWFFFADAFSGATNALSEYNYLVKKVVFQIELLPVVKVVSVLFVQFFFLGFILLVYAIYGYYPSVYNLQVFYYLFCMFFLVFSLSILSSGIVLFFKDLNQIIVIVLQIGFWFTPIGWPLSILSEKWRIVFELNPMYYIVQGYRDSFIDHQLFYQRPVETLYFWFSCAIILTAGVAAFRKLKPHFADVL